MAHLGTAAASAGGREGDGAAFWTACPHCCHVHSYPRSYLGRRLRCPTPACRRAFPATELAAPPPVVPGTEMYYCTWGFFPLGPPAISDGWAPCFTPIHPFNTSPSPSPAPNTTAAATTPVPASPTSRRKVGVCLKGRANSEAEEEEEEEEEEAAFSAEAEADVVGEKGGSGVDINEAVYLSDLGFRVDDMGVLHDLPSPVDRGEEGEGSAF